MHDKTVRRRRAVLGLLVALSLILLSIYFGEATGGPLHSVQRGVVSIVAPIQDGASMALKPVRDLFGWVGSTLDAKSQRDKLRGQVRQLETENARLVTSARQYSELAALMQLDQSSGLQNYKPVTARVIGVSPTVWYSTITVAAGSSDGVHRGNAVISGAGLIGKVTTVTPDAAIVTLITDSRSGVSARDAQSGSLGIVQPAVGNPDDLLLQYVSKPQTVNQGDLVVTSGTVSGQLDSLFPPNIPIGRVKSVNPGDVYEDVHLTPVADLRQLDFVQLLTRSAGGP